VPFGISNAGVVVGSWLSAADSATHGFVRQQGSCTACHVPLSGYTPQAEIPEFTATSIVRRVQAVSAFPIQRRPVIRMG
jgi:hypothetical protein